MKDGVFRVLVLLCAVVLMGMGGVGLALQRRQIAASDQQASDLRAWRARTEAAVQWEYKVLSVHPPQDVQRTGESAVRFTTITPGERDLNELGQQGWELVNSYLEIETAWPNFGNDRYVTGMQPNVRPQRAVLLFRRPVRPGAVQAQAQARQ